MATYTNYVINPSIEVDLAGWSGTGISRSTAAAYRGTGSMAIASASASAIGTSTSTAQMMPTAPGSPFALSVYATGSGNFRLQIQEFSAAAASLVTQSAPTLEALTGGWTRYVFTGTTTHASAAYLRVRVSYHAGINGSFDAWMLSPTLIAYFDGDSSGAVWTGTSHASTSVLTITDRRIFPVLKVGSQQRIGPLRAGKA